MSGLSDEVQPTDFRVEEIAPVVNAEPVFVAEPYHRDVADELLLADLVRVGKLLGRTALSQTAYEESGQYSFVTYCRRFGSWKSALLRAGLEPAHFMNVSKETLLADIVRVAKKLNTERLRANEYFLHGKYSRKVIYRHFGRWQTATEAAKLVPVIQRPRSLEEMLENLKEVWMKLGRQPRYEEMKPPMSRFGASAYAYRFGSYHRAIEVFVESTGGAVTIDPRKQPEGIVVRDGVEFATHRTSRTINARLRFVVMRRDDFKCRACGRSPATHQGLVLQVDHVKPWSAGGESVLENLQTLCETCNAGKSDLCFDDPASTPT